MKDSLEKILDKIKSEVDKENQNVFDTVLKYVTDSDYSEAGIALGYLNEILGHFQEANRFYNLSVKQNPTSEGYVRLGKISMKFKEDRKAEKFFRQARALDPDNPFAIQYLIELNPQYSAPVEPRITKVEANGEELAERDMSKLEKPVAEDEDRSWIDSDKHIEEIAGLCYTPASEQYTEIGEYEFRDEEQYESDCQFAREKGRSSESATKEQLDEFLAAEEARKNCRVEQKVTETKEEEPTYQLIPQVEEVEPYPQPAGKVMSMILGDKPEPFRKIADAESLDSRIAELSEKQRHSVASSILWGASPYTKEEGVLLLEDENDYVVLEGIKEFGSERSIFTPSTTRAKTPKVFVSQYRLAVFGRLSHGTGEMGITSTLIDIAMSRKYTRSLWFNFDPQEEVFLQGKTLIGKKDTGYTKYEILPASIESHMFNKTISITERLTDLRDKSTYIKYNLVLTRKADADSILNTILQYQQNPKTITPHLAYAYFMKDPKLAAQLDKARN